MYISEKYWNHYIGDTDDSLSLADYLADRQREEISLAEIFSDIGLDRLKGDFRGHDEPLAVVLENAESDYGEPYLEFYYAIDIIADLAALLLECRVNGSVNMWELSGDDQGADTRKLRLTATEEEHTLLDRALKDFVSDPLSYDVSEMCPEEELMEMAKICEELRQELYGPSAS